MRSKNHLKNVAKGKLHDPTTTLLLYLITVFLNDMTQKPNPLTQLRDLAQSHGAMPTGQGLITGVIALSLGILCFLGVLAFHFPEYLTHRSCARATTSP